MTELGRNFLKKVKDIIVKECQKNAIDPYILIAQAALETGCLTGKISKECNNLFNIKYSDNEKYVKDAEKELGIKIEKKEYNSVLEYNEDKKPIYISSRFRKYATFQDSVKDYIRFVDRFTKGEIMKYKNNPYAWYVCLQKNGYATDPGYADKLIKFYNLYKGA